MIPVVFLTSVLVGRNQSYRNSSIQAERQFTHINKPENAMYSYAPENNVIF